MEEKSWTVQLDGVEHQVALHWSYWGGARDVLVDGEVVDRATKLPFRWRSEQSFDLGGHRAVVSTKPARRGSSRFAIELTVDGSPVPSTSVPSRWEAPGAPVGSGRGE